MAKRLTFQMQNIKTYYYFIDKSIQLFKSEDIETNSRFMPNILETYPPSHRWRYKTFIACIIKLQPKYQHLEKIFLLLLKINHPNHINATKNLPHLIRYLNLKRQHLEPRLLFALITTISPNINSCEHQLIRIPNSNWTSTILDRMTTLQNPPERHIHTPHPYTQFTLNHEKIINPPITTKSYTKPSTKHHNQQTYTH